MANLDDGFPTKVTFSGAGSQVDIYLYEKEVTPPGLAGGGAIDTTTMRNITYRTKLPKALLDLTSCSFVGAYDPDLYTEILTAMNTNQEIVVTFPDDSTLTFWGWVDEFTPNALIEGEQPTASITIIPSNWDGTAEIAPAMSP